MFNWLKSLFGKTEPKKKIEIKEKEKTTLVMCSGYPKEFEAWCKLNSYDLSQRFARNLIQDMNLFNLKVEEVKDIVFTGRFWDNPMLHSPKFRNFFREWEKYIAQNTTK